jgi:hypothetical protein
MANPEPGHIDRADLRHGAAGCGVLGIPGQKRRSYLPASKGARAPGSYPLKRASKLLVDGTMTLTLFAICDRIMVPAGIRF